MLRIGNIIIAVGLFEEYPLKKNQSIGQGYQIFILWHRLLFDIVNL